MKIPGFGPIEFCGLHNDITTAVAKKPDFWLFWGPTKSSQSLDRRCKLVKHFRESSFHEFITIYSYLCISC